MTVDELDRLVSLDQLVTGAEIGRRLGISRQRVHQLARSEGFPAPLGRLGSAVVWRWGDVACWAARRAVP